MEKWKIAAIAEVGEVFNLLFQEDFTAADLRDRLRGLLEYIELDPDQDPTIEDCDL
jgi:hypothetical protein